MLLNTDAYDLYKSLSKYVENVQHPIEPLQQEDEQYGSNDEEGEDINEENKNDQQSQVRLFFIFIHYLCF